MRYSTGFANALATAWATALNAGVIDVFSGTMPTDGDNAISGTLLVRITKGSGAWTAGVSTNGLVMDTSGVVNSIHSGDTWSGVAVATGVAGFAVFKGNTLDTNGSSTTLARILLTVGLGTGECQLSHIDIVTGETIGVTSVALTQPRV